MAEHEMLPPTKAKHTNPEWGKHEPEIRFLVSCKCGWHDHVRYNIQAAFNFHLEEIEEYNRAFKRLIKEIREAVEHEYANRLYPDMLRLLPPMLEALPKKPTRAEQFAFASEVARLLNEGDIDWDHNALIDRFLGPLYVSVEKPRTKKPKVADTAKALGIELDDDDDTPALHSAPE